MNTPVIDPKIVEQIAEATEEPNWYIEICLGRPELICTATSQREAGGRCNEVESGSEEEYVAMKKWHTLSIQAIEEAETIGEVEDAVAFSDGHPELLMLAINKIEQWMVKAIKSADSVEELLQIQPSCIENGAAEKMLLNKLYNLMLQKPVP